MNGINDNLNRTSNNPNNQNHPTLQSLETSLRNIKKLVTQSLASADSDKIPRPGLATPRRIQELQRMSSMIERLLKSAEKCVPKQSTSTAFSTFDSRARHTEILPLSTPPSDSSSFRPNLTPAQARRHKLACRHKQSLSKFTTRLSQQLNATPDLNQLRRFSEAANQILNNHPSSRGQDMKIRKLA